jgi:D-alanyl-D-alanine endopeptidase (penicillin-binding protein 7)
MRLHVLLAALMLTMAQSGSASASTSAASAIAPAKTVHAQTGKARAAVASRRGKARPARSTRAKTGRLSAKARERAQKEQQLAAQAAEQQPIELQLDSQGRPRLDSSAFYVANQKTGEVLLEKNAAAVLPIASITKLMTAMVVLESGAKLDEELAVTDEDIDHLKGTSSRLAVGTRLSRRQMLQLALMSSENRAAAALSRHYPGGRAGFVQAMNIHARLMGMDDTRFHDSTGLNPGNVSSPRDLARLVMASARHPLIREFSTMPEQYVDIDGRVLHFSNTNSLVKNPGWEISVSKTGYISEAGRCLVMQAWMRHQPMVIVLLDSDGRHARTVDALRIRKWLEETRLAVTSGARQG